MIQKCIQKEYRKRTNFSGLSLIAENKRKLVSMKSILSLLCIVILCTIFSANCRISKDDSNHAPTAHAGENKYVHVSDYVELDGSESYDNDEDSLSFSWSFISVPDGNTAIIENPDNSIAHFTPDVAGEYKIELSVDDGNKDATDSVSVFVYPSGENIPPVADAGDDRTYCTHNKVILNGSNSFDPDDSPESLSSLWEFISLPAGSSLSNSDIHSIDALMSFFEPDVKGTFTAGITVYDGEDSAYDKVTITIKNSPPFAIADVENIIMTPGETAYFDGSRSSDYDDDPLSFKWSFLSVPEDSSLTNNDITGRTTAYASMIPDVPGLYIIALQVSDGNATDSMDIPVFATGGDDGLIDIHIN